MNTAIIEKLTAFFDAKPEIILAMLYGSCSRGTETEKSDVDIAVAMPESLTLDERLSLQLELALLLKREIDLVDIRKITGSALLHRHTMTALYWYADYYPIYKRGQRYILEHTFKRNLVGDVQ